MRVSTIMAIHRYRQSVTIYLCLLCSIIAVTNVATKEFTWREWWKRSVIYQIYPRSFMDSDGDGVGDLQGIISRLEYFPEIGVNTIWLGPFFKSPMADFGYDISDFKDIDPIFGTLADFDAMIAKMHQLGVKLMMDFVPNHTSDKHIWFQESKKSNDSSNEYRDYYVWKEPKEGCADPLTEEPDNCLPNNWLSQFSGTAWEWVPDRHQYYLHQFAVEQAELNFREPRVHEELKSVLRFWFERGVDAMRVDAVRFLYEGESFADEPVNPDYTPPPSVDKPQHESLIHTMTSELPEVHDVIKKWKSEIFDEYSVEPNYRLMVTENYDIVSKIVPYYGTEDEPEADFPFNFQLLKQIIKGHEIFLFEENLSGIKIYNLVHEWMVSTTPGQWPNWVVGTHDGKRIGDRLGYRNKRSVNVLNLLLPGTPTTYYGEEIGMENIFVEYNVLQDPLAKQNKCCWKTMGRDPQRSPMQWDVSMNAGFSSANKTWLPVNDKYLHGLNVEDQLKDPHSTLHMYKKLTELRRVAPAFHTSNLTYLIVNEQIFSFLRIPDEEDSTHYSFIVTINFSNKSNTDDYSNSITDRDVIFVDNIGAITVSSNMDRNGRLIDLTKVELRPGEALVIETRTACRSKWDQSITNIALIGALILITYLLLFR